MYLRGAVYAKVFEVFAGFNFSILHLRRFTAFFFFFCFFLFFWRIYLEKGKFYLGKIGIIVIVVQTITLLFLSQELAVAVQVWRVLSVK